MLPAARRSRFGVSAPLAPRKPMRSERVEPRVIMIRLGLGAAGSSLLLSCGHARGGAVASRKLIILGVDGLDPDLLTKFMAEGKMPNFARLAGQGSFRRLTTSIPPQSPVAWSNLITGMNAGGHGIFDFIHRDPKTFQLYFST